MQAFSDPPSFISLPSAKEQSSSIGWVSGSGTTDQQMDQNQPYNPTLSNMLLFFENKNATL